MEKFWKVVIVLMAWWQLSRSSCPEVCVCELDIKGRIGVSCTQGDMVSIPVDQMDVSTEVIIISAPNDDYINYLTIGPIFTQPKRFTNLEEIHIVQSNVPSIGQNSFWGLRNLRLLNLTYNNISAIVDHNFRGLIDLVELYLDNNRIEEMPSETFHYLMELRILSLSNNRISVLVPRLFRKLGKLNHLDLSDNPLVELAPEVFKDIQELKTLKCRRCKLKMINTQLYHLLAGLQHLDLGENHFKYVMSDEFNDLKKLQVLKYDGNQLPVILEKTFGKNNFLTSLSLARNRLAMVTPTAFLNLSKLTSLDISYNKLDRLDVQSLQPVADSLWTLDISGNHIGIQDITIILQLLVNIRNMGLANLGLSELPLGIFTNNQQLKSLNLSGNHFTTFPVQTLAPIPYLLELDLTENRLSGLDEKALSRFAEIPKLWLDYNPWICDVCHIGTMLAHLKVSYLNASLRELICVSPKSLEGYRLGWLSQSELEWCGDSGARFMGEAGILAEEGRLSIIASLLLLLFVVLAALTAGICYSKRRTAQYYTNEDKRGPQSEKIFDNQLVIFGENDDLNFKFPVTDISEKPFSLGPADSLVVSTISPQ